MLGWKPHKSDAKFGVLGSIVMGNAGLHAWWVTSNKEIAKSYFEKAVGLAPQNRTEEIFFLRTICKYNTVCINLQVAQEKHHDAELTKLRAERSPPLEARLDGHGDELQATGAESLGFLSRDDAIMARVAP